MNLQLLDTQKALEFGADRTGALEGPWGITTYTLDEFEQHGLRAFPTDTTFLGTGVAPSWDDFKLEYTEDGYEYWSWEDGTEMWQILHYKFGFGTAPSCGHNATIMMSGPLGTFKLCEGFRKKADMSNFMAVMVIGAEYPFTGDACLGRTGKFYQELKGSDSTSWEEA